MTPETNHISTQKTEPKAPQLTQEVKAQKPMSIDEYLKALRKEAEVARLRALIATSMFNENMALAQLNQLRAGQNPGPMPQPKQEDLEESRGNDIETTQVD